MSASCSFATSSRVPHCRTCGTVRESELSGRCYRLSKDVSVGNLASRARLNCRNVRMPYTAVSTPVTRKAPTAAVIMTASWVPRASAISAPSAPATTASITPTQSTRVRFARAQPVAALEHAPVRRSGWLHPPRRRARPPAPPPALPAARARTARSAAPPARPVRAWAAPVRLRRLPGQAANLMDHDQQSDRG